MKTKTAKIDTGRAVTSIMAWMGNGAYTKVIDTNDESVMVRFTDQAGNDLRQYGVTVSGRAYTTGFYIESVTFLVWNGAYTNQSFLKAWALDIAARYNDDTGRIVARDTAEYRDDTSFRFVIG